MGSVLQVHGVTAGSQAEPTSATNLGDRPDAGKTAEDPFPAEGRGKGQARKRKRQGPRQEAANPGRAAGTDGTFVNCASS